MASQNTHFLTDFFKDKAVKVMLKILLFLIVLYGVYAFGGVLFGYKVKFLPNQQKAHTDTVYIQPVVKPAESKIETPKESKNPPIVYIPTPSKKIEKPIDTTPKIQAKNVNTGTNSGIVGDVTVNKGMAKRELTGDYKRMLVGRINDSLKAHGFPQNYPIKFNSYMGSNEAIEFTKDVINYLYSVGFTGIKNSIYPYNTSPNLFIYLDKDEGEIMITLGVKQ